MTELRDLIRDPNAAELALLAEYGALPADARRERAFEAFAQTGLPHRRVEAFKWTDVKRALPALDAGVTTVSDPFEGLGGATVRFSPGSVDGIKSLPKGVNAQLKTDGFAMAAAEALPLGALTAALARETLLLEITEPVDTPLRFVFSGTGELSLGRVQMLVRPGASVEIYESHLGGSAFSSALVDITVQKGGSARRTLVQPGTGDVVQAVTATVQLDEGAEYTQTALSFGDRLARLETRLTHQEPTAKATLNAAYLAGPGRHVDFTSFVRHGAVDCVTEQRTKGAVLDGGEGVFQGKFFVPRGVGQRTSADMQHNALLLEDGAVVNAKPELEIYADDVECAHGNTCGALDAEALFYMRQRGIPEATARALLTEAFIAEALETAPEAAREVMLTAARSWLTGE